MDELSPFEQAEQKRLRRRRRWRNAAIVGGIVLVLAALPKPPRDERQAAPSTAPSSGSAVERMATLEQMELAFDGSPSKRRIQERLDRAMALCGLELTEENYSRAGSTLVALRKQYGPSEMQILDYMIRSHVPGASVTFPQLAGMSAAMLKSGDR